MHVQEQKKTKLLLLVLLLLLLLLYIIKGSLGGETSVLRTFKMSGK